MGLRGLMSGMGMNLFAMLSMVLFVGSFMAILVWTLTRPSKEIESCANLPLHDNEE